MYGLYSSTICVMSNLAILDAKLAWTKQTRHHVLRQTIKTFVFIHSTRDFQYTNKLLLLSSRGNASKTLQIVIL
mgnify:FL=1